MVYFLNGRMHSHPNCRESHALNVIQLADKTLPGATTVYLAGCIADCCCRQIGPSKPVRHDLIDALGPPLSWSEGQDSGYEDRCHKQLLKEALKSHNVEMEKTRGTRRKETKGRGNTVKIVPEGKGITRWHTQLIWPGV